MIKLQTLHQHKASSRHTDENVLAYFAHIWSVTGCQWNDSLEPGERIKKKQINVSLFLACVWLNTKCNVLFKMAVHYFKNLSFWVMPAISYDGNHVRYIIQKPLFVV